MSKKAQDGRVGEGGMVDNIEGEVGSIPPYPTFIPPGPKKLFCLNQQNVKKNIYVNYSDDSINLDVSSFLSFLVLDLHSLMKLPIATLLLSYFG